MDPTLHALLRTWALDPWLIATLVLSAFLYTRGWLHYRVRLPDRFPSVRWLSFLGGLVALFLALASPIEAAASLLFADHMIQHLLLMMVAPPLLLLGSPLLPMVWGMPRILQTAVVGPLLRSRSVRRLLRFLSHPVVAWSAFVLSTWFWHVPRVYELALLSPRWHYFEHVVFFTTALLFWWPVVQPYPSRARWSRWLMIPYLLAADLQNTLLSALFAFSGRAVYSHYDAVPRLWGISAVRDQEIAGALMWIPGSIAYLVPVGVIGARLLFGRRRGSAVLKKRKIHETEVDGSLPYALPVLNSVSAPCSRPRSDRGIDLLHVPILGSILRWRYARVLVQAPMFVLALVVIADGFWGPKVAPMNLAGVLPWIHWRGLVVFGLLAVGNVFCFACPFPMARRWAGAWLPEGRKWPVFLRNKWLAAGLLLTFFWAYEVFALWSDPVWTATLVMVYFLVAFAVDGWFKAGSFCKYVCPIGQFHFFQSLISPFEIKVRDLGTCQTCSGRECIQGGGETPGCELGLFLPRKGGNFDCTFCLDCVHSCPRDNVGLIADFPGRALLADPVRSGIGRLSRRFDLACLTLLLVFSAFANAMGMVGPVVDWQGSLARQWSVKESWIITGTYLGSVIVPGMLVAGAIGVGKVWRRDSANWRAVFSHQVYALVPLGASMWLVHFAFHFLTSYGTWLPVTQRLAGDLGFGIGEPEWTCGCCVQVPGWLLRLEILFLDLGLLGSLYLGFKHAEYSSDGPTHTLLGFLPMALVLLGTFAWGIWIVLEPMQMRGTMLMAGG
ncbi:MAG: cytochrome c oxidase assembly protein [Planctomycetota bacterium]